MSIKQLARKYFSKSLTSDFKVRYGFHSYICKVKENGDLDLSASEDLIAFMCYEDQYTREKEDNFVTLTNDIRNFVRDVMEDKWTVIMQIKKEFV